ncbi:LysM peptidoglycan-binding domain-containing protein, partial [Angustibacter peucedani]
RAPPARATAHPAGPLRLTRRGRLAVTGLLAAVAVVASLFIGGVGAAGTRAEPVPVRYVTVTPGATLWAIAGEVAPDDDRRDTVARILELNALQTSAVHAGQRLAVPAS